MERELWSCLTRRLDALPKHRPAKAQFSDHQIVRVILWATLRDRPINWACRPCSWLHRRLSLRPVVRRKAARTKTQAEAVGEPRPRATSGPAERSLAPGRTWK